MQSHVSSIFTYRENNILSITIKKQVHSPTQPQTFIFGSSHLFSATCTHLGSAFVSSVACPSHLWSMFNRYDIFCLKAFTLAYSKILSPQKTKQSANCLDILENIFSNHIFQFVGGSLKFISSLN